MTHFNIEHEWDEDGECSIAVEPKEPCWRWSHWDLVGIALHTASSLLVAVGNGLNLLSRECQASANFSRAEFDRAREEYANEVARAEMAGSLEGLVLWGDEQPIGGDQ